VFLLLKEKNMPARNQDFFMLFLAKMTSFIDTGLARNFDWEGPKMEKILWC